MSEFNIAQKFVLAVPPSGPKQKCKFDWVLETQFVDGLHFVKLQKYDRGFVRFVHGIALDRRNRSNIEDVNCKYFDRLLAARNRVCDDALVTASRTDDDVLGTSRKRARKAKASDALCLIDRVQMISMDGQAGSITARVLVDDIRTSTLWIECTVQVFDHLKSEILAEKTGEQESSKVDEEEKGQCNE